MATTLVSTTNSPEEVAAALETTPPAAPAAAAAPPVPPVAGGEAPAAPPVTEVPPAAAAAPPVEEPAKPAEGEPEAEGDDDAEVVVKPKAGDRVGRLKYDRYVLRQENRRLQKLMEDALVAKTPAPPQQQPPTPPVQELPKFTEPAPKIEDYDTIEQWTEKMTAWTGRSVRFEVEQAQSVARANTEQEQRNRANSDILTRHQARVAAYREAHPEFGEVLQRGAQSPPPMTELISTHIFHSDLGPELMEYLDAHRDEASRIAALPPGPCLVALGRIEAKLESPVAPTAPPAAPVAPAARRPPTPTVPIKPLGAGSTATQKNPDEMTHAEFKAWRASGGGR